MSGFGWESSGGGGGSLPSGFLQVAGGVPLDSTLRTITDGLGTSSPLQLSTTSVSFGGSTGLNWDNANTRLGIGTNTPLGILHLKTASAATRLVLDGDAAQNKIITYRTAGVQRFGLYTNNTAESGSNVGSDFAIRAYSDAGTLLSTPIFIKRSTGFVGIGTTTTSARLHVRGDGTNPIARFEDNTGSPMLRIENSVMRFGASTPFGGLQFAMTGTTISGNNNGLGLGFYSQNSLAGTSDRFDFGFGGDAVANTAGTVSHLALVRNFAAGAGSGNFRPINLAYTINNSGAQTGNATGILLNATETALNGMTHNLMDLQVGGASKFKVTNNGGIVIDRSFGITFDLSSRIVANSNGQITFTDSTATTFVRLNLGGTTNAFPSIKRNGAAIDFRLADDSGFCNVQASQFISNLFVGTTAGRMDIRGQYDISIAGGFTGGVGGVAISQGSNATPNASALLDISSTTRGFLPPRMTTTQKNAIATPAEGLIVHDTTNNGVSYFDGTNWGYLSGAKQNLTGAGGTLNVPFRNGNIVDLALNSSTTLTFGSHVVGTYIIEVTQGGTGSNTLTFPASVKWSGGVPPTLTTVVGKTDVLTFFHDGTFFYGTYSLNY